MALEACETFNDQAGARVVDVLSEVDRLPAGVQVAEGVELVDADQLHAAMLPAGIRDAVHAAEREVAHLLRSAGMSHALHAHRTLSALGLAIEQAAPGEGRAAAIRVHEALIRLAVQAGMAGDHRTPFSAIWPRVRATVVAVERPRTVPGPVRPWLQRVSVAEIFLPSGDLDAAVPTPLEAEHPEEPVRLEASTSVAEPAPIAKQA